jgi:serine/threonine protein phosphatase PrpC
MEDETTRIEVGPNGALPPDAMRWISASSSHVGKVRKLNEDSLLDYPQLGLWAVADGVGGASAGDLASSMTTEVLSRVAQPVTASGFLAEVCDRLRAVNTTLREQAEAAEQRAIATTVVALLFFQQHFACTWAGDSRLYLMRDGQLRQVSHDHSAVQEMVDRGIIRPQEARGHPRGNVVTRAVGAHEQLDLETVHDRLCENDVFLLCSDGLTKTVADDEIALMLARPVDQAVQTLMQMALDRGAPDNVTVVAVKVLAAGDADAQSGTSDTIKTGMP